MGAEGRPTLALFSEDASHETLLFEFLTPTPRLPMAAEGCPTLAPFSLKTYEILWKSMKIYENN